MREIEVAVRYELMQRILGPTLGRLETEFLNPLIERVFGTMMRASSSRHEVLPPPPPILAEMGVTEIDIEYEGPLAKAQRMNESKSIQKVMGVGAELSNIKPDVMDNMDMDSAYREIAEVEGVPSKVMRSQEEVAVIREERRKAQAIEQQKQDMERLAAGIKDVTPAGKVLMEAGGGE